MLLKSVLLKLLSGYMPAHYCELSIVLFSLTECKCEDTHEKCSAWAESGECGLNLSWLSTNCPKSCRTCGGKFVNGVRGRGRGGDGNDTAQCSAPLLAVHFNLPEEIKKTLTLC